jgi:DUF4097 and DUF4098 domain-containing protein YvlB
VAQELLDETAVTLTQDTVGGHPRFVVEVDFPRKSGTFITSQPYYRIGLTVMVPADSALDLDLRAANGWYDLTDISVGTADLELTNGRMSLDGITGHDLSVQGVNGRIDGHLGVEMAELSTTNGDINIELDARSTTCTLDNTNGKITIEVAAGDDVGFSLDGRTLNGRVEFDLGGLDYSEESRRRKVAETPGYATMAVQVAVDAATLNGNVRVAS